MAGRLLDVVMNCSKSIQSFYGVGKQELNEGEGDLGAEITPSDIWAEEAKPCACGMDIQGGPKLKSKIQNATVTSFCAKMKVIRHKYREIKPVLVTPG